MNQNIQIQIKMKTRIFKYRFIIAEILKSYPESRDNDIRLFYLFLGKLNIDINKISGYEFLEKILIRKIPNFESIRRTRQKLQEHNPALRGELYFKRHQLKEQIKSEVINEVF